MVYPNSYRISPVLHMYWNISMICIHLLGLGGGGGCSLSRIGLVKTCNELLQVEVGVTDCLVGEEVLDRFLHLYLCWDLIANLEGVTMVY